MSYSKQISIHCDDEKCNEFICGDVTVASSREWAKQYGWRYYKGKDYCSIHASEQTGGSP
jgi:hypothetical protein